MGNSASSRVTSKGGILHWQAGVHIIQLDGKILQFKEPIKAEHVLSQNPNCFMCSSESMHVGSLMPRVTPNEDLQLGHIYFLMPRSKSKVPLSLHDLCTLAIKANAALLAQSNACHSQPILKSSCFTQKLPFTFKPPSHVSRICPLDFWGKYYNSRRLLKSSGDIIVFTFWHVETANHEWAGC